MRRLSDAETATLERNKAASNSGMSWREDNMTWTRYNHVLSQGKKTCVNSLTWNRVAMTANSRHIGSGNPLLGDSSTRFVKGTFDPEVWQTPGTIAGGEASSGDSY